MRMNEWPESWPRARTRFVQLHNGGIVRKARQNRHREIVRCCPLLIVVCCLPLVSSVFATDEDIVALRAKAEQGHAAAQYTLGLSYAFGTGVSKDHREAVKWYRQAAEQGHRDAQLSLGNCFYNGKGVPKHDREAIKWFHKAAEQGNVWAQCHLGRSYHNGEGVPKNSQEAIKWYRKAAMQNHEFSQMTLGRLYFDGQGVSKDYVSAYAWYNLAASHQRLIGIRPLWNTVRERRSFLAQQMTEKQIAAAQTLSQQLAASIGKDWARPENRIPVRIRPRLQRRINPDTQKSQGTGFFIAENGYLLTNFHVVKQATKISVRTSKGTVPAKLVRADKTNDLALLKVDGHFQALPLKSSQQVTLGNPVFTIGFPNTQVQGIQQKYTRGRINSLGGIQDDPRQFQISVPIQPGNSGGPLVDLQGNVVGIIVGRLRDIRVLEQSGSLPQNVNYAVKSSFALAFLETLPDLSRKLKRPRSAGTVKPEEIVRSVQDATVLILVNQPRGLDTPVRPGLRSPASPGGRPRTERVGENVFTQPRSRR